MTHAFARRGVLAAVLAAPAIRGAAAAPVIDRPARMILGYPGGSAVDLVARSYAEQLRGIYAPSIVVENRPGGAAQIAMDAAKAGAADGSTLLVTPESALILYPHIYRRLRYDPLVDFIPVSPISSYPFVLAVAANHPARDLQGFAAWARAKTDEVNYASPAPGSSPHFYGVLLARDLGLRMTLISYRDTNMIPADLFQGRLDMAMNVLSNYAEHHRAGRARILAVSTPERVPSFPDVPTFAESGVPGVTGGGWYSVMVPAGTPRPIVTALNEALTAASRSPDLTRVLGRVEQWPTSSTPEALHERIRSEIARWGPIVRDTGFTADE